VAVRVHFSGFNVGRGEVWAYGADETVEGAFTGAGEFGDGYFWTGSIAGDRVTVEYIPAPGEVEEWIPFRIESVSHIWSWPAGTTGRGVVGFATAKHEVAPCHLDFKCAPEWATSGAAVAAFIVEKPSSGLVSCSGSLRNQLGEQKQPYFLTAAHCVASEAEARSLLALWNYESPFCDGPEPSGLDGLALVVGSNLIATGVGRRATSAFFDCLNFPISPMSSKVGP
jgi:lysyl endopeptidase